MTDPKPPERVYWCPHQEVAYTYTWQCGDGTPYVPEAALDEALTAIEEMFDSHRCDPAIRDRPPSLQFCLVCDTYKEMTAKHGRGQ